MCIILRQDVNHREEEEEEDMGTLCTFCTIFP